MVKEIIDNKNIKIEYDTKTLSAHYEMTPYTFNPKYGKKMMPNLHTDLGQGLVQVAEEIHNKINQ